MKYFRPFHPRRSTVIGFASGEAANRAGIAQHLEHCDDCRRLAGFTQRLGNAAKKLPAPLASELTIARALASRADGLRVILPVAAEGRPAGGGRRLWKIAPIVAAAAAVLFVSLYARSPDPDAHSVNELLLAGLMPRTAQAAQIRLAIGDVRHVLQPLTARYQRRFVDSATKRVTRAGVLDVRVARARSADSWLLTSAWRDLTSIDDMQKARVWAESLTVTGSTFAPESLAVHVTPYRRFAGINIRQTFRGDSVIGEMTLTASDTRRPIARDLRGQRGRIIAGEVASPLYFMGVSLYRGAECEATMLGWAVVDNDVVLPMHMRVVGSERVETPAGTFDCWKILITAGNTSRFHWVRKSDHLGVLTQRSIGDGKTREIILVGEGLDR
jgi:hypothetical protein